MHVSLGVPCGDVDCQPPERMPKRHIPMDGETLGAIGRRIRAARVRARRTQAELAACADLEPATLSRLETGKRPVSTAILTRIARELGVSVAELLGSSAPTATSDEETLLAAWRSLRPDLRAAALLLVVELGIERRS